MQSQGSKADSDKLGRGQKVPPAKAKYMGRRVAQAMSFHGANWLIRDTREAEERPSASAAAVGTKASA